MLSFLVVVLLPCVLAVSVSGSSLYSFSRVSLLSGNYDDYRFGDPATSSVSHADIDVTHDGGINYGAQAASGATFGRFSLFTSAGGNASGFYESTAIAKAQTQVFYSDSIVASGGLGPATIRIPFLVEGITDLSTSAGAVFGFTFCQSIPTGSQVGGVGCEVNGLPAFWNSEPPNVQFTGSTPPAFSQVFNLDFHVPFGIASDLNYTVTLQSVAFGRIAQSTADFSHTGIQLPAQVFDQFGTLVPDATITAQSGLDYFAPQIAAVPEPCSIVLAAAGLVVIGLRRRSDPKPRR